MADIITCQCGAKVRLPSGGKNRALRCPKCKLGIAVTVDARVLSATRLAPGDPDATCPICQTNIGRDEVVVTCTRCDQVHHRECWAEVGGCGTYGCEEAPRQEKAEAETQTPLSAWGDDKTCPACGETIKAIALRCRYCGTDFNTVDPLTVGDLRRQARREDTSEHLQRMVISLFVVSIVLPILAPITAVVSGVFATYKHSELLRQGPLYLVLGYSSLVLSVIYSVLMLVFAVI